MLQHSLSDGGSTVYLPAYLSMSGEVGWVTDFKWLKKYCKHLWKLV